MAKTESTMLALGTPAPSFTLPDVVSGRTFSPSDFADARALLVMFISRHCPYVKHVEAELARLGRDGLAIVAICSNDVDSHPDDRPESLKEQAEQVGFPFPYLYDESQSVAVSYAAACTPDFFLFDAQRTLVYRGQLDDSRPGNGKPVTGHDLRAAIDAVLSSQPVDTRQIASMGCNIKWKAGKAPSYS